MDKVLPLNTLFFEKKKIECKNLLKIADVNLIKQLPQYPY